MPQRPKLTENDIELSTRNKKGDPCAFLRARVLGANLKQSSTGKPEIAVLFLYPEHDAVLYWDGYLSDAAIPYTLRSLNALRWEGDVKTLGTLWDYVAENKFDGVEAVTRIERNEYLGRVSLTIAGVHPLGEGEEVEERDSSAGPSMRRDAFLKAMAALGRDDDDAESPPPGPPPPDAAAVPAPPPNPNPPKDDLPF